VETGGRPPPRLRRILTGGAPVSDSQLRRWRRVFPDTEIVVVYGSTEAEPVAHLPAEERLAAGRSGGPGVCAGPLSDRLKSRIVRIERGPIDLTALAAGGWPAWELPPGAIGELVVSGEHVCRGYFRAPEADRANKIVEPSGRVWHRMGDTGYLDDRGRFWLVGRVHTTILRRGEPVHALPVEQAARGDDPRVRRVAAVGLADPELGERVVVVVEAAAGEAEAVRDAVAGRLAAAGHPVDELLVTGRPLPLDPRHRSKVDVGRLRRLVERGGLGRSGR
jgi:acyl-CoA synthetase (AMP-forming)/AMP-acid ligase II